MLDCGADDVILHSDKSKGKVFYGQDPPSIESTTTECGVNHQQLAVMLLNTTASIMEPVVVKRTVIKWNTTAIIMEPVVVKRTGIKKIGFNSSLLELFVKY